MQKNYNEEKQNGKKGMVFFFIVALIEKILSSLMIISEVNSTYHEVK